MFNSKLIVLFGFLLSTISTNALAALAFDLDSVTEKPPIQYTLTVTEADHHLAEIVSQFDNIEPGPFNVIMPAWRTGRYRIANFANGVRSFQAYDQDNKPLVSKKVDKNTWQISVVSKGSVFFKYTLYANDLGGRTRHIDDTQLFLDATAGFMYNKSTRDLPLKVSLNLPAGWRSISGMKQAKKPHTYLAPNYAFLADAPIQAGIYQQHSFQVDGKDYELVIWGEGNYSVTDMLNDLKKLVPEGRKIWGSYPFNRYIFMVHATSGIRGATEHINSTIIQRDRFSFAPRKDYLQFLGTASHEFIHTWNVKAYRPKGIQDYDFEKENYTPLLWVAEGSTSYFTPILLVRAGIMKAKEYHSKLADDVNGYWRRPGRQIMDAAHSSFDAWIEQGADFTNNFSVNIYSQGSLLSLLVDLELRQLTDGKKGYEDIHRLLYERFPLPEKGYTEQDMINLMTEVSGKSFDQFWQTYIRGTQEIDFKSLLEKVGLSLHYHQDDSDSEDSKAWVGINYADKSDVLELTRVERNSPAWKAGLAVGDVIVAINSLRVTPTTIAKHLDLLKAGQTVDIAYFRRDQLKNMRLTVGKIPQGDLVVKPMPNATAQQKKLYSQWLGIDWPEDTVN